jgi:hypothetical protein
MQDPGSRAGIFYCSARTLPADAKSMIERPRVTLAFIARWLE